METQEKPYLDFDHLAPSYRENWEQVAKDLHATGSALAWSPNHGGFWVLADYEACLNVLEDWETFTSYNDLEGTGNGGRGQIIPQAPYRLDLGESDPPIHSERRRLEAPFFTPRALRQWGPLAQQYIDEAIDSVIENGSADLVGEVIIPTTARTTLYLLGYHLDWRTSAEIAHKLPYVLPSSPEYPNDSMIRLRSDFRSEIADRRSNPRDDLISALAKGHVNGELLTEEQAESMMNALVFGGFDTTTSSTAHAMMWLTHHPEFIPQVRDDPAYRKNAIEELLRFIPPTSGIARTAVKDTEILGQKIAKGERIQVWFAAANRDPKKFENPDEVQLDRANASDHLSFSGGSHRCLGSPLAKLELNIMIETLLRRMPDLVVDETRAERYPAIGFVNGFIEQWVTFTPGSPIGTGAAQ